MNKRRVLITASAALIIAVLAVSLSDIQNIAFNGNTQETYSIDCASKKKIEPEFFCLVDENGGYQLEKIRWTKWNPSSAEAIGTFVSKGFCSILKCAKNRKSQVRITMSETVKYKGEYYFTRVKIFNQAKQNLPGLDSDVYVFIVQDLDSNEYQFKADFSAINPANIYTWDCEYPEIKPKAITLTCADGGMYLDQIKWSQWGAQGAQARAIYNVNDCKPSCAEGNFIRTPVKLQLSKLSEFDGKYFLRNLVMRSQSGEPLPMLGTEVFDWDVMEFAEMMAE